MQIHHIVPTARDAVFFFLAPLLRDIHVPFILLAIGSMSIAHYEYARATQMRSINMELEPATLLSIILRVLVDDGPLGQA